MHCDSPLTVTHVINELSEYDLDMKSNLKLTFEYIPEARNKIDFTQGGKCPCKDMCSQVRSDYTPKFESLLSLNTALNNMHVENNFDKVDE